MRAHFALTFGLAVTISSSGCLARQVAADGRNFRQALLDMYTDQIMDNLIRAAENRAFVQISYRALTVTDAQILKANLGAEADPTQTNTVLRTTAALVSNMYGATTKLLYGSSLERDRTMQIFADPVLAKDDVYTYYLAFAHDPSLFVCSDRPPCGPVHIKKKCGGKWYWVPDDAAGVFLQLALRTTFMRGTDPPPPLLWDTTIDDVQVVETLYKGKDKDKQPSGFNVVVKLKKAVPNSDGLLFIDTADGNQYERRVLHWPSPKKKDEEMVQELQTQISIDEAAKLFDKKEQAVSADTVGAILRDKLKDRPAQFYTTAKENRGELPLDRQRLEAAVKAYNEYRKGLLEPVVPATSLHSEPSPQTVVRSCVTTAPTNPVEETARPRLCTFGRPFAP
jgi:hypothetical protein